MKRKICIIVSVVVCIILAGVLYQTIYVRNSSAALFNEIDLDDLQLALDAYPDTEELAVIYIARTDCATCVEFKKEIKSTLHACKYKLTTYFTNQDREGERSEEMYALLDEYGIESVPSIVVIENGNYEVISDPLAQIEDIKAYIEELASARS